MQTESKRQVRKISHELVTLIGIFLLIFGVRSSLADHYIVPTGSMEYTLMPGDRVVVDKRAYGLRVPFSSIELSRGGEVERGEVVIFDSPVDGTRLIKRVVAVAGDSVVLEGGHLWINGIPKRSGALSDREEIGGQRFQLNLSNGGGPNFRATVPSGHVLTVGDHRGNSRDGRMYGFIPTAEIYGRALAVYFRRGAGFEWQAL